MMVNYLKPCFPFGFNKCLVGAQRQQHFCACPQLYPQQKEQVQTYAGIYAHERALHRFPEFFRDVVHTPKLFVIAMKLEVGFSSKQNSNSLPSPLRAAPHGGWAPDKGEAARVGKGEGLQMPDRPSQRETSCCCGCLLCEQSPSCPSPLAALGGWRRLLHPLTGTQAAPAAL